MRGFIFGIIVTLAAAALLGWCTVWFGWLPSSADQKPSKMERWAANRALGATIDREAGSLRDPLPLTDENLSAGVKLYGANCIFCHGAADAQPSMAAKGFYIRAPQLAKDGVEDDPEYVTYWKVAHGIRFTAMPSFATRLTDDQIWQVAQFVAHMDKLPPAVDAQWKALPSAQGSPAP